MSHKKTRKNKFYGHDKYMPYSIHKTTLISFDPLLSCKTIKAIFGKEVSNIHDPPDKALKKRGIKWIRFNTGGKAELHFVPPIHIKHYNLLIELVSNEDTHDPISSQFFDNHVGIHIADLTHIVLKILKLKIPYRLIEREDGLLQLYVNIPATMDYLELDSIILDEKKIKKYYPHFTYSGFKEQTLFIKQIEKSESKYIHTHSYIDPNHNNSPRTIRTRKDGSVTILGKDGPNDKMWKINGMVNKDGSAILDFSPKGGPKKIKAIITPEKVTFSDGNVWSNDEKILYKLI